MFSTIRKTIIGRVHPFMLLGMSLGAVVFVSASAGIWHHKHELKNQVKPIALSSQEAVPTGQLGVVPDQIAPVGSHSIPAQTPPQQATRNLQTNTQQNNAQPATLQQPTEQPTSTVPLSVTVSLYVNEKFKGKISLATDSNQCQVLQKALDTKAISSLDMRYSNQYGTHAVYMIEGQGDSGSIWWAYTVNGKSPPYGCSKTKVAEGDSINWQYVKQ